MNRFRIRGVTQSISSSSPIKSVSPSNEPTGLFMSAPLGDCKTQGVGSLRSLTAECTVDSGGLTTSGEGGLWGNCFASLPPTRASSNERRIGTFGRLRLKVGDVALVGSFVALVSPLATGAGQLPTFPFPDEPEGDRLLLLLMRRFSIDEGEWRFVLSLVNFGGRVSCVEFAVTEGCRLTFPGGSAFRRARCSMLFNFGRCVVFPLRVWI